MARAVSGENNACGAVTHPRCIETWQPFAAPLPYLQQRNGSSGERSAKIEKLRALALACCFAPVWRRRVKRRRARIITIMTRKRKKIAAESQQQPYRRVNGLAAAWRKNMSGKHSACAGGVGGDRWALHRAYKQRWRGAS